MKLFNALVTGQAALMSSAVLGLEDAAIQLPEGLEAFDDATFAEHVASYEQHMADYHTLQGRISSLEDMLETIGDGTNINPQQAALIESTVEKAVDGTDISTDTDVVPGLESVLTNPNYVLSTEGIKETIGKLMTGAKNVLKKAMASLGKLLGSLSAKGYLVKERLKDVMEDVKAKDLSTDMDSFELRGLAQLLTAEDNVPNDAPELIKFLDRHIAIAKAITVDSYKIETKLIKTTRIEYGKVLDKKTSPTDASIVICKAFAAQVATFPVAIVEARYDGQLNRKDTMRSLIMGGEKALISNHTAVADEIKELSKSKDNNSSLYLKAMEALNGDVVSVKKPGDFKSSKVKPMTKGEFSKVADKILELIDVIAKVNDWPEEYEKEMDSMWAIFENGLFDGYRGAEYTTLFNVGYLATDLRVRFIRTVLVRLMSNAENASVLLKKMAAAQIKAAK